MDWLKRKRLFQVITFGWKDSLTISKKENVNRIKVYSDIVKCFLSYHLFSNQYITNNVWNLSGEEKENICIKLGDNNKERDKWIINSYKNKKFIEKWSSRYWTTSPSRVRRKTNAYAKMFNTGEGLVIQHNVDFRQEHFLTGKLTIGKNVLFAKNVYVDYSGDLIICDNVRISDGVMIETHSHQTFTDPLITGRAQKEPLIIHEGVNIGTKAIVLESCNEIGRYARIGSGAVVRTNIPPYAIVTGNPAKIVGFVLTPKAMVEFEKRNYEEKDRLSYDDYERLYNKYFTTRLKEIRTYSKRFL